MRAKVTRATWGRELRIDLGVYVGFAAFAAVTAWATGYYGHRVWGNFGIAGYALAAVHTGALMCHSRIAGAKDRWWQSRWLGVGAIFLVSLVAPLVYLVIRRLGGTDWQDAPHAWTAQPEVWVIERSASLLLRTGSPYIDVTGLGRPPVVDDYTPYGPVMAAFGMPRALLNEFGRAESELGRVMTDARVVFALVACACVALCLKLLGRPRVPVRAAQLVVACPATALTWAVAGPDLAILGLLLLAVVLAARDHPAWAGVVLALVVSAKLTAAPAILVLAVMLCVRSGGIALARFATTLLATCAVVNLPVWLVNRRSFIENTVKFPSGSGAVESPAASPLPGHLIAGIGPTGEVVALVLLGLAAAAITAWVLARPPRTGADAMLRIAVGLGTAILLTPATRWGYLVYPLVLLGACLCVPDDVDRHSAPTAPPDRAPPDRAAPASRAEGLPTSSS
ncbi:MAG: glycosyltransferase 87 family protein [Pseudonocardiaceae bacterium]